MNNVLTRPWLFLMFLLPAIGLYVVFMGIPLVQSLYYAFFQWDGVTEMTFVGLDNFAGLLEDEVFRRSFFNNVSFILFSTFISMPIIVAVALLLSQVRRFQTFYRTGVFLPTVLSTAVVGVLWLYIYHPDAGLLNNFLRLLKLDSLTQYWLSDPKWAMISVLVANAWQWTGFYVVLVLAAILGVPRELTEAAEIDGANVWQKTWFITLPLIRPVLVVIFLLNVSGSMKALDIIMVMTEGGPFQTTDVLATYMVTKAFREYEYGYGSAIAVVIFLLTLLFAWIIQRANKKEQEVEL
ncbi:carbohydrate ABC transporter permease [Brevibacillus borstelensis]|uniref:Binding-protein-dependent transport system inner membrane protein n=1 Tax=Brevibacillus borstelensis AK1 TaxID=1300222 RepID=M8D6Q0_9BACL|nr:sugar ABC transporter permease [Brevibacillus borstelensis]EMT51934.1 binding-protein-dependent transport system inner membrane protein [Brevibacillus borstelensis AK1]